MSLAEHPDFSENTDMKNNKESKKQEKKEHKGRGGHHGDCKCNCCGKKGMK